MTTELRHADDGVHRLVDMVVEEVSLVDRAANKHRFLIVKRDDSMDDDNTQDSQNTQTNGPSPSAAPAAKLDDGTALGAALTALESLTGLVELLGSIGADQADARLAELAQELRSVAEQLLARTVGDDEDVEARAKTENDDTPAKQAETSNFAGNVTAAKQALERLAELAAKVPAAKTAEPPPTQPPAATEPTSPSVIDSLAKLAESFRTLSETVKQQQLRLGRVEKQFGLPNSAQHAERGPATSDTVVGWPLDLNMPKDRENVDKAVSFHDL